MALVASRTVVEPTIVPGLGRGAPASCSASPFAPQAVSFTFHAPPYEPQGTAPRLSSKPGAPARLQQLAFAAFQQPVLTQVPTTSKLEHVVSILGARFRGVSIAQVWTSCLGGTWYGISKREQQTVVMSTAHNAAHVSDSRLQDFRARSCQQGITGSGLGMLGKVMSSGVLQVVQNVAIIPKSVHPRNKLEDQAGRSVSELVYIPVFDTATPEGGVIAVLEVIISAQAVEAMLVANVISFVGELLGQLQLSLSKPPASPAPFAVQAQDTVPLLSTTMLSPPTTQEMDSPTAAARRMRCPSMARTTSRASFDLMQH